MVEEDGQYCPHIHFAIGMVKSGGREPSHAHIALARPNTQPSTDLDTLRGAYTPH